MLLTTFLLRLWGVKQGLPYSYNTDEATHFVPRAVGFFGHDFNPHYFLNPPACSYVLHFVFGLWFGGRSGVARAYATKYTGGVMLFLLLAASVCDAAAGGRGPALRRLAAGLLASLGAFVIANPYALLDFDAFRQGVWAQASIAAGQDPVKLGSGGSGGGPGYLPVDVHLGARLGAHARRARRRHPAAGAPPRGHGARAAPLAGRVHRLHGRPAAVLRPLADADLPDHRRAGRYGAVELVRRLARIRRVPPLLAGVAVGVLLLAQPEAAPGAIAYYAALARRGTLVFRTTPFAPPRAPFRSTSTGRSTTTLVRTGGPARR